VIAPAKGERMRMIFIDVSYHDRLLSAQTETEWLSLPNPPLRIIKTIALCAHVERVQPDVSSTEHAVTVLYCVPEPLSPRLVQVLQEIQDELRERGSEE
jgi:hypothetical protein